MRFQRTAEVPQLPDYLDYRAPYLRPDFQYRCAYCLTHERFFLDGEAGEVDHHRPLHPPVVLGKDFSQKTPIGLYTIQNIRLARASLNRRRAELYQSQQKALKLRQALERADLAPEHRQTLCEWLESIQEQINPPVFGE